MAEATTKLKKPWDKVINNAGPPTGMESQQVKEWAESLKASGEAHGRRVTTKALILTARSLLTAEEAGPIVTELKLLYPPDPAKEKSSPSKNGTAKKKVKDKAVVQDKSVKNRVKEKTSPSKNGKGDKPVRRGRKPGPPPEPVKIAAKLHSSVTVRESKTGKRYDILGQRMTSVLRWLGNEGVDYNGARKGLGKLGVSISDNTLKSQLHSGKIGGGHHGPVPVFPKDVSKNLKTLFGI